MTHVATGWAYSLVCVNAKKIYGFGLIGDAKEPLFDAGSSRNFRIQLMACGREHSQFVVREDDAGKTHLYSLGNGMYGQLGNGKSKMTDPGTLVYAHEPTKIEGYQGNITHIASGLDHTVFATGSGNENGNSLADSANQNHRRCPSTLCNGLGCRWSVGSRPR